MRRTVFVAAALLAAGTGLADAQKLGGTYRVEGTNSDGSSYGGTAQIRVTSDTTCEIRWTTGGSTSQGICMRYQNAFSAAYILGNKPGLVIYEIERDGSLHGVWTIAGEGGAGKENLYPAH